MLTDNIGVDAPLGPKEVMAMLGISRTWFFKLQKAGRLKPFELSRPVLPRRRYSARLLRQYLEGGSITRFGRGSRLGL